MADGLRDRPGAVIIGSGQAVDPGSCEHEVESEEKVVFPGRTRGKPSRQKACGMPQRAEEPLTLWNRLLHALDTEVTSRHGKSLGGRGHARARCNASTDSEADACRCVGMRRRLQRGVVHCTLSCVASGQREAGFRPRHFSMRSLLDRWNKTRKHGWMNRQRDVRFASKKAQSKAFITARLLIYIYLRVEEADQAGKVRCNAVLSVRPGLCNARMPGHAGRQFEVNSGRSRPAPLYLGYLSYSDCAVIPTELWGIFRQAPSKSLHPPL